MDRLRDVLKTYWGYDDFRPSQREAVAAVMAQQDSLTVLPTGGGKSLCYQAPALLKEGMALVVSPLIALMKDQVDSLCAHGVSAACIHSALQPDEKRRIAGAIRRGEIKLLYLAPERLAQERFLSFLQQCSLSFVAIDEAHCISMWGHDFRPDYRVLGDLRKYFPQIGMHAFTATATPQVRRDIVRQLHLTDPCIAIGSFDRPNLFYRVEARIAQGVDQICAVADRYPGEAGIVYAIRRADVERLCVALRERGYDARPYHAGMADLLRRQNQDAFLRDEIRIIVATVAFGMGINKSNVRYVVHAALPKSLEHYQQESGRAGRDGLPAECVLLHHGRDYRLWENIIRASEEAGGDVALKKLKDMWNFCTAKNCRRIHILRYFGERTGRRRCDTCDVCLPQQALCDGTETSSVASPEEQETAGLFETLRELRRMLATERGIPPYQVFNDAVLWRFARQRPMSRSALRNTAGVGVQKARDYGKFFLHAIRTWVAAHPQSATTPPATVPSGIDTLILDLLQRGVSLQDTAEQLEQPLEYVGQLLQAWVADNGVTDPSSWIETSDFQQVQAAAYRANSWDADTVYSYVRGQVDFSTVAISLICLRNGEEKIK